MTIRSYTLPTKPILRFLQSSSQSLTAFIYVDGTIEIHPSKASTGPPLRIDDDPTFLLLLDVPHNSNEPTTSLVVTFHIHLKERAGSFEVRAYEFLPNLENSNGGSAFGLIPIVLQVGEERLVKDFKSSLKNKQVSNFFFYSLTASVASCPKYITGYGQRVVMLCESNEIILWNLKKHWDSSLRFEWHSTISLPNSYPVTSLCVTQSFIFFSSTNFKSKLDEECLCVITIKKLLAGKFCGCYHREDNFINNKIFETEIDENEEDRIGNGNTEKGDKKGVNTIQMRAQAPRLGCLSECGHLCLIPLNNIVWKNNINEATIYDTILLYTTLPTLFILSACIKTIILPISSKSRKTSLDDALSETKYHTVFSCFPLKDFPIPNSTGVNLVKKSSSINDTGNVEWGSILVGRNGPSVVVIENPSDKYSVNIGEQDTQILSQQSGEMLMASWASMPFDATDGSHSTVYIVAVDQDDMRGLNFQNDFISSLALTGTRGNKEKECENDSISAFNDISFKTIGDTTLLWHVISCRLIRAIFATSHIMDVCAQGTDIIIVAGSRETTLYIGKWCG
ncbi:7133_t:CDS:2 [Dentiscutata erythropus]|uniref:7133_t:CDS:1 n=1 Tax=Dentiscutata erythropus TaxID=1348616 RepID=A0A9N9FMA3_9GLOM|nr:7133_t:CDS:2 [Dentiscutata erythropus]